jgi:hypothetical protein
MEVAGAALLVLPRLSGGSAVALGAVMIVATFIEFFVLHRPPAAALACLTGHSFVAWARVSKRHRSWLDADVAADRASGPPAGTMKARWHFRRKRRLQKPGSGIKVPLTES